MSFFVACYYDPMGYLSKDTNGSTATVTRLNPLRRCSSAPGDRITPPPAMISLRPARLLANRR